MKRLVLVRHTTPAAPLGLCYGQLDLELASSYPSELAQIKSQLEPGFAGLERSRLKVFSSPLKRCRQLSDDLTKAFATSAFCVDEDLIELNFGEWEGQLWSAIPPEVSSPWTENFVEAAPPGGESFRQLEKRALRFLESFMKSELEQALVVTHSGVIRALRCWSRGEDLSKAFDLPLPYGAILEVGGRS